LDYKHRVQTQRLNALSVAVIAGLATSALCAILGAAWQRSRFEDAQLYWFARYSEHLHELVDQHRWNDLTNDIVAFDTKLRPKLNQPGAVQDGMYQILKIGPYVQTTVVSTNK